MPSGQNLLINSAIVTRSVVGSRIPARTFSARSALRGGRSAGTLPPDQLLFLLSRHHFSERNRSPLRILQGGKVGRDSETHLRAD
jgi:hypothetical protein